MKKKIIIPVLSILWVTGIIIILYMLFATTDVYAIVNRSKIQMIYKGITILVIATGMITFLLNKILEEMIKGIKDLTTEAKLFARGEYEHTVRNCNIDEIEQLSNAFDHMGEKMYRTIRKLHYQKSKAESILRTLQEGIVILDEEGYVSEVNEFAEKILGQMDTQARNCHINLILRDSKCRKMFHKTKNTNQYSDCEMIFEDRILYMGTMPIQKESNIFGYILVIRDTTRIRNLEQMRYQFVSNVTHEIKTPLTSIQGFVETLKDGAIENPVVAGKFLDIIDIEAKRLYRLIQDILVLSEIENMENHYQEEVNIRDIIHYVVKFLSPQAVKKDIVLEIEDEHDITLKNVSKDHIEQLVINLVSNAIRYTDQGKVSISCYQKENMSIIEVKDTGIGIPKESIPHIFERFYRVDKGRSRKSGGTGLGLSIVKHLVQLYNGTIYVESQENIGSVFRVEFHTMN